MHSFKRILSAGAKFLWAKATQSRHQMFIRNRQSSIDVQYTWRYEDVTYSNLNGLACPYTFYSTFHLLSPVIVVVSNWPTLDYFHSTLRVIHTNRRLCKITLKMSSVFRNRSWKKTYITDTSIKRKFEVRVIRFVIEKKCEKKSTLYKTNGKQSIGYIGTHPKSEFTNRRSGVGDTFEGAILVAFKAAQNCTVQTTASSIHDYRCAHVVHTSGEPASVCESLSNYSGYSEAGMHGPATVFVSRSPLRSSRPNVAGNRDSCRVLIGSKSFDSLLPATRVLFSWARQELLEGMVQPNLT